MAHFYTAAQCGAAVPLFHPAVLYKPNEGVMGMGGVDSIGWDILMM